MTRVLGTLPASSRPALEANVGKAVSAYVDGAFLSGDYPRSDFGASFSSFTKGAATDARRDQDLLTNHELGPTTESVRATRRTAYLSVLAPHKVAAGVTAKVDLVFVVDRGDQPAQRVRLAGRLLLTRTGDGRRLVDLRLRPAPVRDPEERVLMRFPTRRVLVLGLVLAIAALVMPNASVRVPDASLVKVQTAQAVDHPRSVVWILCLGSDARPGQRLTGTRADAIQLVGLNLDTGARHDHRHPARLLRRHPRATAATRSTPRCSSAARS